MTLTLFDDCFVEVFCRILYHLQFFFCRAFKGQSDNGKAQIVLGKPVFKLCDFHGSVPFKVVFEACRGNKSRREVC